MMARPKRCCHSPKHWRDFSEPQHRFRREFQYTSTSTAAACADFTTSSNFRSALTFSSRGSIIVAKYRNRSICHQLNKFVKRSSFSNASCARTATLQLRGAYSTSNKTRQNALLCAGTGNQMNTVFPTKASRPHGSCSQKNCQFHCSKLCSEPNLRKINKS